MADLDVRVPNIGDFADVPVLDVLVKIGDTVAAEDALITLESEKATMEVPSPSAGTVTGIAVKSGDRVSEGSPIVTLSTANGVPAQPPATRSAASQTPVPQAPPPAAAPGEPVAGSVHAGPAVRRFARELGVAIERVTGTGPHGRITREDVQTHVKHALAGGASHATGGSDLGLAPWPRVDYAKYGPVERVALSRIRKLSGPNLHRNWVMIPHVTNNDEADITDLEAFRKQLHAEHPDTKVTMLAFVMKAVVASLRAFPELNASLDGDALVLKRYYNIAFAADTPGGLVVPVVRAVDTKGIVEVARETAALAAKAREGKLAAGDMAGATFTISSLGGIGGTSFTPIVNAPEVAILGVSRSAIRPHWNGETFVPRLMLPLSLSYDHRVVDGALAARFNAHLAGVLGDLRRAML